MTTHGSAAKMVRESKEAHPENYCGEDRHPRVFKRTVRAERCASWLYVVTADALAKEATPTK